MTHKGSDLKEHDNMVLARDFSDKDIYLMEVVSGKVIINDSYEGVLVLNGNLEVIRRHEIMEDLMIYMSFTWGTELLLHCDENDCLVHLDVEKESCRVIPLPPELSDAAFLSLCEWSGSEVFLLAEGGEALVRIDTLTGAITVTPYNAGGSTCPILDAALMAFSADGSMPDKVYPERRLALVASDRGIESVNYAEGTRTLFDVKRAPFHDLEAFGGYLAQVDEWGIVLSDGNGCLRLAPEPDGYYFCWGRFLSIDGGTAFFTLASNNANSKECRIQRLLLVPGMFTADGTGD